MRRKNQNDASLKDDIIAAILRSVAISGAFALIILAGGKSEFAMGVQVLFAGVASACLIVGLPYAVIQYRTENAKNPTISLIEKNRKDESSPPTLQNIGIENSESKQVEMNLTMYKEMEREGLISNEDYQKLKRKLLDL